MLICISGNSRNTGINYHVISRKIHGIIVVMNDLENTGVILDQGWANYGPRAACGRRTLAETSIYLIECDRGSHTCRTEEPKTFQVTIERAATHISV